jgi:hypothetical protein
MVKVKGPKGESEVRGEREWSEVNAKCKMKIEKGKPEMTD